MDFTPSASKGKVAVSILSADLTVVGNLRTTGDIQVEGTVEGDIRAHLLTVAKAPPFAVKSSPMTSWSMAA